ncbi:chitin-binding protein [Micromonospora zingiberis]|uniref:Chitin-binding protein n=2 Tax=Micromonospora zingiberis TaxID=2053011 RepID=A0A4R0FZT1_9ACTN|nr:chitin-binding protein [Micromonospora zingiberis]
MLAAVVAVSTSAVPAAAQGAPSFPVSRSAACAPEGRYVDTPACRAAVQEGAALREWDNVRVFGVDGRDRERIPDGELCSGGLSAYRGLDLARTDWPVTALTAGAEFDFRYQTTVPHKGTFRVYLTRAGYVPTTKLTWAQVETVPFLRVTDPPIRDGVYQMSGRLPADRVGRHVIYTIWQNSDTSDSYYSCSDVNLLPAGVTDEPAAVDVTPAALEDTSGADAEPAGGGTAAGEVPAQEVSAQVGGNVAVASVTDLDGRRWSLLAGVALGALLLLLIGMRLRGSRSGPPPGRPCTVRNHRANPRVW